MRTLDKSDRAEALARRLLLLASALKSKVLKVRWEHIRLDLRLLTVTVQVR